MSVESSLALLTPAGGALMLARLLIMTLSGLYFAFSLIIVRQVSLMTETLITEAGPIMKALAILHCGFALGIIVLLIGYLFG
jgi:hypothetical protein